MMGPLGSHTYTTHLCCLCRDRRAGGGGGGGGKGGLYGHLIMGPLGSHMYTVHIYVAYAGKGGKCPPLFKPSMTLELKHLTTV